MLAIAELAVGEALSPNGTVFAISDTAALTARHCVYDGETLLTPLVAILPGGIQLRASLLDEDERADVALLLLKDPLPEKWEPVALLDASECRPQTPFVVSGYPAQRPFKDADTMDGHIVSVSATAFDGVPVITLFSSQVAASVPRDPHGFSGAPVLVTLGPDGTKLAVGLIRWSEIDPITGLVRAGSVLAAPLEPLSRRWPQLARAVVTVPSTLLLEPKVPDHFQDRDLEVNRALALIAEKKWCGLYGLTGTGKTSTAARIARHVRLKERNCVVWLTLGAQADISIVLEGLANAVGNSLRMLPDAERKVARLRAITSGLGRLIVFDDVRSSHQLYGVLSGVGDGNSVLITSQQEYSVPAIKFGIISIPLDALSSNDGACVLLKLLRIPDAADRLREWETLAAALGNHPLALEVAAGDIQLGDFKSPLQYIEDRISTGKWARGEPTLQRLQKTVLDGLKQAGTAHPAKFKTLAAFEGRAVSKFVIKNVCRLPSEEATDTFVRDLLLRGILRRRSVNVFALHPFILHIASLANTQRERSLLVDAQRRHVNHYCNLLEELGGYEWNLSKYPEIVPEEFEVFHAIDAAARIADHDQDDALRDLCIGMTTLISWYLHWRGYWDLRVRFCKRVTDMAEQAGSQASFEGRKIQIGNLYVDRGWVHLEQGDIESAEICAVNGEKWLFGSGDQIFARELQAQVLHQMGHFGQAVAIFESLAQAVSVARRPWFVFSYRLADSLFALGDTKRSSFVLQDLICKLKQPQLVHNEIIEDVKGRIQYRAALRHISIGDEASAFALLEEAVRSFASSEIVASERAAASIEFATLLANRHLYEDSRQTLEDAGRLARRAGDFALVSRSESLLRTLPMKVE